MAIRVGTLKRMGGKWSNRGIYRVRWRQCWKEGDRWVRDEDGRDKDPDTWKRWDQEFYLYLWQAELGREKDSFTSDGRRPRGVIDQLPVRVVWAELERLAESEPDLLTPFDEGRHRHLAIYAGWPGQFHW